MTTFDESWKAVIKASDATKTRLGVHSVAFKKGQCIEALARVSKTIKKKSGEVKEESSVATAYYSFARPPTKVICNGPGSYYSNLQTRGGVNIERYFSRGKMLCFRKGFQAKVDEMDKGLLPMEKVRDELLRDLKGKRGFYKYHCKETGLYDALVQVENKDELIFQMENLMKAIEARYLEVMKMSVTSPAAGLKHKSFHGMLPKLFYMSEWNKIRNLKILGAYKTSIESNASLLACVKQGRVALMEVVTFDKEERWGMNEDLEKMEIEKKRGALADLIDENLDAVFERVGALKKKAAAGEAFLTEFTKVERLLTSFLFISACELIREPTSAFARVLLAEVAKLE